MEISASEKIEALEEESRHKEGIYYNLPPGHGDKQTRLRELKDLEKFILRLKKSENASARSKGQKGVPYPEIEHQSYGSAYNESFICTIL